MGITGDEDALVAAASKALGEDVLAAGIFGWQDLVAAQALGLMAGGAAADLASGGSPNPLVSAAAAGAGGAAAVHAAADAAGMTVALLVALTTTGIHVLNWADEQPGREVVAFARSSTNVHVSRFGLSRIVQLHDMASGAQISLHASVSPLSAQSKPDKVVLHLLAAPT